MLQTLPIHGREEAKFSRPLPIHGKGVAKFLPDPSPFMGEKKPSSPGPSPFMGRAGEGSYAALSPVSVRIGVLRS